MKRTRHRKPGTVRRTQVLFVGLLLLCVVQTLWWLFDQARFTAEMRDRLTVLHDRAAERAVALHERGTPLAEIAATYPELDLAEHDGTLVVGRGYRAVLAEERGRHMRRYGWEGAFFAVVLVAGLGVVVRALRQWRTLVGRQHDFIAAVTHEFKNPLASIKLSAETLERRPVDDARRAQLSERMLRDVDRLETMVSNLLGVARLDAGDMHVQRERVVLQPLAAEMVRHDPFLAKDHGVDLRVDVGEDVAVRADPRSVRLVLSNLLDNAVKSAVAHGGQHVRLLTTREEGQVRLDVEDDGLGFEAHQRPHLFSRFYRAGEELQRRTRGTGLGLYLVQQLVRLDGGRVDAQSDGPGRGARFSVWWTAATAEDAA